MIIASATTFRNVSTCSDGSHGPHLHLFKAAVDIIKAVKPEITSSAGLNNSQLAHNEWTNSQSAGKVAGLTNRSFITAKTISVSHTISARAPGGASTARSRRLSAPGSVQDQNRPVTALSLHCSTPGQVCFREARATTGSPNTWRNKTGFKFVTKFLLSKQYKLIIVTIISHVWFSSEAAQMFYHKERTHEVTSDRMEATSQLIYWVNKQFLREMTASNFSFKSS